MNDMPADQADVDPSFEDYALPPEIQEVAAPAPLKFAPWHKPRKQYVREFQWIHHARQTIARLLSSGEIVGGEVRYLTLPGPDMIDVKMMIDLCSELGVKLKYTGFCDVDETEAARLRKHTSQFHMQWRDSVHSGSDVHSIRLEGVSQRGSEASTLFARGGPYHVINIDACEPLAVDDAGKTTRLIDALKEIVLFQFNKTRHPWLLYLTTPVELTAVSPASLDVLRAEIKKNFETVPDFAEALESYFGAGEVIDDFLGRTTSNNGETLCKVFSLGIAKWLVHLSEQAKYRMFQRESFCYSMLRRTPTHPNMISTCYVFVPERLPVFDRSGLTSESAAAITSLAKSAHLHALEKSMALADLDNLLKQHPEQHTSLAARMKDLLADVGYDVEDPNNGYEAWLAAEAAEIAQPYELK